MKICSVEGCGAKHKIKGLCRKHYDAARHSSNLEALRAYDKARYALNPERFKAKAADWAAKNPDRKKKIVSDWHKSNPEKHNAHQKQWAKCNKEKISKRMSAWSKANSDKCNAKTCRHRANKLSATPSWANEFIIEEAYHLAKLRTKVFGFKWHVDHIVPLQSKLVCGLHVEHNLQVIPAVMNLSKGNRRWPDMPE